MGQVSGDETFSGYATPYGETKLLHFLLDGHAVARLYGWATVSWAPPSTMEELVAALGNLSPNTGGACYSYSRSRMVGLRAMLYLYCK